MEKEISESIGIGITLAALAALIGVIFFTVYIGNTVKANAASALSGVRDEISVNYVRSLASGEIDNEMPAATAYNILKTYDKVIMESAAWFTVEVTNLMTQESSLKSHMFGRVQLQVIEVPTGGFIAFIHPTTYDWKSQGWLASCRQEPEQSPKSCKLGASGFDSLIAKYHLTIN